MTLGVSVKSLCELLFRFADFEPRDAEALFDYSARSSKELSFRKGDIIRVFKRFNTDWWDGTINGSDGFVPAKYIRIPNDDNDPDITDGEGNTSPGELPPFPGGDRPRDLNVPPRIPKREGSLRGRDSLPSPTELASPTGHSPQSGGMSSFKKQTPITSTPTSSSGGSPAISSEDIVKRQLTLLRKAPREEKDSESSVDKTPDKEQSSFNMPRLRSISPTRKSSWPSRGGEDDRKTGDTPGGAGNVTKEEHQRSSEVIWQPRGESPGIKPHQEVRRHPRRRKSLQLSALSPKETVILLPLSVRIPMTYLLHCKPLKSYGVTGGALLERIRGRAGDPWEMILPFRGFGGGGKVQMEFIETIPMGEYENKSTMQRVVVWVDRLVSSSEREVGGWGGDLGI